MNKFKIFFGIIAIMWTAACTDFVEPAIPYSDFTTGVYLRTLVNRSASFDFFDIPNQKFNIIVEVVGANEGKDLAKDVEVYVRRRRGATLTNEVKIATIAGSEFGPNPSRVFPAAPDRNYPAKEITITLPATLTALGLSPATVTGGDFIEYRLVLNTNDGKSFTNTNLSADISGGAFYDSPFFYRVPLVCPSTLDGEYNYSTVGWCGKVKTGKLKFVQTATAQYEVRLDGAAGPDFSFGAYNVCYSPTSALPLGSLKMTDACGRLGFIGASQWGEIYTFNSVTVAGPVLTLDWKNDYDPEAGVTTITRTDGKNWPPLTK